MDSTIPDYVPGPEGPPSPDYVPGPEEPEQAPPSPIYIPFVPEPVYPEFLPVDDESSDPWRRNQRRMTGGLRGSSRLSACRGDDDDDDAEEEEHLAPADPTAVAYSADQDPYLAYRVTARMSIRHQAPAPFLSEEIEMLLGGRLDSDSPFKTHCPSDRGGCQITLMRLGNDDRAEGQQGTAKDPVEPMLPEEAWVEF
ncbi:hypothetical protein Tco_0054363 [Tanacetum coccineum]